MHYQNVTFLQGDESSAMLDLLYNWRHDPQHVHYLGVTSESIDATFAQMVSDYGEGSGEISEASASGTSDDSWEQDGWRLTASLSYGYVGLERLVRDEYGEPVFIPPAELDTADANGGFTAMIPGRPKGWGIRNSLWRPASIAKAGTTGRRIPGTVKHDANYQGQVPVISADYRIPRYPYPVRVWFSQDGERIA
jgi:hypothetical protein